MKNIAQIIIFLVLELCFCSSVTGETNSYPKASMTISIASAQQTKWEDSIKAAGSISPWKEAVISSRVNGLALTQIEIDIGSKVKRGQILARFDDSSARAELLKADASYKLAASKAYQAKVNRERALSLKEAGAVSQESILEAITLAETTNAQLDQARADLALAKVHLKNTIVVAPDSGVITTIKATLGQVFGTSTELFRMNRQNRLEWRAEIPAQKINLIKIGQQAEMSLPDGTTLRGKVRQVAPSLSSDLRLGIVYVDLNQPNTARASMYIEGKIQMGLTNALVVPAESVVIRDGRTYVFLVKGSRVKRIKVVTGRRKGKLIEIKQGLEPGHQVAVRGSGFLSDGETIKVQEKLSSLVSKAVRHQI